jgi:septal ring factor EnvC (AmiA/AmiB activator)
MESQLGAVLTAGRDYEETAGRTKVTLDDSAEAARKMLDEMRSYGGELSDAVTYAQDVAGANERAAAAAEREAAAAERTANARRNTPAVPANTSPAYGNGAS